MKLFTKIALGIAGFFASIALICGIIAFSMGLTADKFMDMVNGGAFSIKFGDDNEISFFSDGDVAWYDDEDAYVGGENSKTIVQDCRNLELEYGAGQLEIYYGDVLDVQVDSKNVRGLKITVGGEEGEETLYIEGDLDVTDSSDSKLVIILPKEKQFEYVDMELGASQADIDGLQAEEIDISVGAGQANISNVNTRILDMEVGAGEADVTNLTVWNLNLEVGVGKANVQVNGAENDFNYRIECGIGEVVVGNKSYGGLGAEQNIKNQNSSYVIDIECGIGKVDMQFLCKNAETGTCGDESHHH